MSIEANAEVSLNEITGETKVDGGFKYQFGQPLIIKECEHLVQRKGGGRIFNRREIWEITTHGRMNGRIETKHKCFRLE
ncbi:MAG: hypothetical protein L0H53_16660 [Candidatus Nitrosocosmicus sp.]|nr:hypothetical protein [Candidatus Nitrosocosmicus sp.]MDN5867750.1 hypothetical protein [Candidatus Nitrosocosmicus sp.]